MSDRSISAQYARDHWRPGVETARSTYRIKRVHSGLLLSVGGDTLDIATAEGGSNHRYVRV
ncbi:hypothetical protein [Mycolicibacterium fortuitum]